MSEMVGNSQKLLQMVSNGEMVRNFQKWLKMVSTGQEQSEMVSSA